MSDDTFADWDAAYLLGMLSPEDRRAYERHLTTCDSCAAAVAELAGLPGILSALTPDEAVAVGSPTAPAVSSDSLVRQLAHRVVRRRRRIRVLAASVAVVVAAGAFVVGTAVAGAPTAPAPIAMTPVGQSTVAVALTVTPTSRGTRLDWNCAYGYAGPSGSPGTAGPTPGYDLVVTDTSGHQTIVAKWDSDGGAKTLTASTDIATSDIRSVEVTFDGGDALARAVL